MTELKAFLRRFSRPDTATGEKPSGQRKLGGEDSNTQYSHFSTVAGRRHQFISPYRIASNQPIAALLKELKLFILTEEAKVCIYDLLEIRLHMKWPGSDSARSDLP